MSPVHVLFFVLSISIQDSSARPDCKEWHECRQLALDAASRQDYETFHDLAWRAVQTGPRNDPALMYLLARAQSLSGRPGDALVMLQRLAQMGTRTDAATNEDFRRVRALPGWADLASDAPAGATQPAAAASTLQPRSPVQPEPASRDAVAKGTAPPSVSARPLDAAPKAVEGRAPAAAVAPFESVRFTAASSTPAGIAYDAVSRRFIVGDREASRLTVVDEFSQHVANLASAQTAGFGTLAAFEIDPRQGNLWVVSGEAAGAANPAQPNGDPPAHTTLHKLQLVSGRVLQSFILPDRFGAARFSDVAVTPDSTVLVLDVSGRRIFRLRPKASDLEVAATLSDRPSTIAPASDGRAYVAIADGVLLVDLSSRATTSLKAASGVDLGGLFRLRWHKGALIGIQQSNGSYRAVRITLDSSGRRAIRQQVLDASLPTTDPTAATVAGDVLYYLASGEGAEMVIRKIALP